MRRIINRGLILLLLISVALSYCLWRYGVKMERERTRYLHNTEALLADIQRIQIDSTRMAVDVNSLRLTVSEFERYRAEDAELIKQLGIKVRNLEAAAKHQLAVNVPIEAPVRDSIIIRDTILVAVQTVEMITPYVQMRGMIEDDQFTADLHLPVTLNQAVWVEYQRKFPWIRRRVKAVHQTISSDNPHVEIEYSEYIRIGK